jgi:hypothetical protein
MCLRLLMGLVPLSLIIAGCGAGGSASSGSPATSVTTSVSPAATASHPGTAAAPAASASATSVQAATAPIGGHCSRPAAASTAQGISGMQFTSRDQGWAVGSSSILATTDGGVRWRVQLSGALNLTSVDFVNGQDGWAVGDAALLATTDGGAHWSPLPEPCLTIRSVHFISAAVGFAVAGGTDVAAPGSGPALPMLGGVALVTVDGGRGWRELATAPAGVQTVCYSDARHGWLGAGGVLYRTANGGATWTALTKAAAEDGAGYPAAMDVECASEGTVWALSSGPGAGMSQQQHVGYYGSQSGVTGLFAEQTMQAPGTGPARESPGSDPGPFSAIGSTEAVYIDACTACGMGTAPWDLVSGSGATLAREGNVAGITAPEAASFLSAQVGWVAGEAAEDSGTFRSQQRIMATANGGRTWVLRWAGPWTSG